MTGNSAEDSDERVSFVKLKKKIKLRNDYFFFETGHVATVAGTFTDERCPFRKKRSTTIRYSLTSYRDAVEPLGFLAFNLFTQGQPST